MERSHPHKVVTRHNDQARWSAAALMRPFIMGYHENGSTPPENAVVYHGLNDIGDHVYYFSPEASTIAIATKAFHTFDATQCAEKPGYPFSPGHYVISITYRESLMALPGQGQRIDLR
jgi:hypothetical protein